MEGRIDGLSGGDGFWIISGKGDLEVEAGRQIIMTIKTAGS